MVSTLIFKSFKSHYFECFKQHSVPRVSICILTAVNSQLSRPFASPIAKNTSKIRFYSKSISHFIIDRSKLPSNTTIQGEEKFGPRWGKVWSKVRKSLGTANLTFPEPWMNKKSWFLRKTAITRKVTVRFRCFKRQSIPNTFLLPIRGVSSQISQ